MSKFKNREEFEGGLKRTEEFEETNNKSPQKQGRISTGGDNFSGCPEYIPLLQINHFDCFIICKELLLCVQSDFHVKAPFV